jgi:hypothetical protein
MFVAPIGGEWGDRASLKFDGSGAPVLPMGSIGDDDAPIDRG